MTITHGLKSSLKLALKKISQLALLSACLTHSLPIMAQDSPLGQTFQINTRLESFVGKPAWVIIVKDVANGQVVPYYFPIYESEQFWINFTFTNAFRVILSELQFGPPDMVIRNFCHLQDGILDKESLIINLTGRLTPDRRTSECHVERFKSYSFPIVTSPVTSTTTTTKTTTTTNSNPLSALSALAPLANMVM
ncbi:MAG: hypothetical protein V4501_11085 [Pseudomonadota bacterium]